MQTTPLIPHRAGWMTQSADASNLRLNRRSVLIVDDQIDSVQALSILLEWAGHEVHLAMDGLSALQAASDYHPDLIFLDISMPGLNGYEVCRRLRDMPAFVDARIYALSALSGEPHTTRCSEAGFTGRLTKPVDPEAIEKLAGPAF